MLSQAMAGVFEIEEDLHFRRYSKGLALHNTVTGELVALADSTAWTDLVIQKTAEGSVLKYTDEDGEQKELPVASILQYSKQDDELLEHSTGLVTSWEQCSNQIRGGALTMETHQGNLFRAEMTIHKVPRHVGELGTGTVMMHTRWLLSFLGGHTDHNWASHSSASLTNKLLSYLQRLATGDGLTEAEIQEAASKHLTKSRRSETMTMRNKRKASDAALDENEEDGEAEAEAGDFRPVRRRSNSGSLETSPAGEYTMSMMMMLVFLLHLSCRKISSRNGWKAGAEMVAARATMLLRAIARIFVRAAQTVFLPQASVEVRVQEDCVQLHVPHLVQSCRALRSIQDIVEEGDTWVDMVEVMQTACQQEVVGHRLPKRRAYELAVAVLCKALADLFEGSRLEEVWSETELWHMQPLKTLSSQNILFSC